MKQPALIVAHDGRVARIVLSTPIACACGRMVMMVINRDGKTRCIECDEVYVKRKEHD